MLLFIKANTSVLENTRRARPLSFMKDKDIALLDVEPRAAVQ
ncbi:hypothetical protein [Anaplasma phagocytophilum]|nr:hypothetical protein [Anaplasma phagocytophilum]